MKMSKRSFDEVKVSIDEFSKYIFKKGLRGDKFVYCLLALIDLQK
jgi:hypothetical protein